VRVFLLAVVTTAVVGHWHAFQPTDARLVAAAVVPGNALATDTLDPPTGLAGSGNTGNVTLQWTGTADSYAAGYKVLRSSVSGGPYSQVGSNVTPRSNTSFVDSPGIGTRYYVVASYFQNWTIVNSNQLTCIVALVVFTCA
jgi:hypothetical protein